MCTRADGKTYAWGNGGGGLLAKKKRELTRPTVIKISEAVKAIAMGADRACAALEGGACVEWGSGTGAATPTVVAGLADTTHVACGPSHSAAATAAGAVHAWSQAHGASHLACAGSASSGTAIAFSDSAARRDVASGIVSLACGAESTFVATRSGTLLMAGRLYPGGTVNKAFGLVRSAATGRPLEGVVQVAAGSAHAIARCANGDVYSWGAGACAGHAAKADVAEPTKIACLCDGHFAVTDVACGAASGYAVTAHGNMLSWGANGVGQLGQGSTLPQQTPRFTLALEKSVACIQIRAAGQTAIALVAEGPQIAGNYGARSLEMAAWNKVHDAAGALSWDSYVREAQGGGGQVDAALKEMATALMMLDGMDVEADAASMTRATDATDALAQADRALQHL